MAVVYKYFCDRCGKRIENGVNECRLPREVVYEQDGFRVLTVIEGHRVKSANGRPHADVCADCVYAIVLGGKAKVSIEKTRGFRN